MRIARTEETNFVFVSSTTFQREQLFRDTRAMQWFLESIRHYERRGDIRLDTYCVMPDHYHAILEFTSNRTLTQILHDVHSLFVWRYHQELNERHVRRLWAHHSWDEWIRSETMYWQKVAYTLLNPWRAGLVDNPLDDYPGSNIAAWKERLTEKGLAELFGRFARSGE